jgi:chromosome segregation ATPase
MQRTVRAVRIIVSFCCCLALVAGCSSNGKPSKASAQTVQGLGDTRKALVRAKEQVNETTSAMNALASGGGDMKSNYARFSQAVAETQRQREMARKRGADMREQADAYIASWQREMADVDNPELRAGVEARRERVRQNFDSIRAAAQSTRDAYEPYMKDLQDIQKVLGMDLTPQGLQTVRPVIDKANADARVVNERLDALIAQLDNVSSGMTPTGKAVR